MDKELDHNRVKGWDVLKLPPPEQRYQTTWQQVVIRWSRDRIVSNLSQEWAMLPRYTKNILEACANSSLSAEQIVPNLAESFNLPTEEVQMIIDGASLSLAQHWREDFQHYRNHLVPYAHHYNIDEVGEDGSDFLYTMGIKINPLPLLSPEQEVSLGKRLEIASFFGERDWVVEDQLYRANIGLIVSQAKKYFGRSGKLSSNDLFQEGSLGIMRAMGDFDWKRGFKFSTYAIWWINSRIRRAVSTFERTASYPIYLIELMPQVIATEAQLMQAIGRVPSPQEVAAKLNHDHITPQTVEEMREYQDHQVVYLGISVGVSGDTDLSQAVADMEPNGFDYLDRSTLPRAEIEPLLRCLTQREKLAISVKYLQGHEKTNEEVGREMEITRERARQLVESAIKKLRPLAENQGLIEYLK